MKRSLSIFLAVVLLLTCVFVGSPEVYAASKKQESRAIAIVFDNSGSMYLNKEQAWCRATYAMEVFASMLNPGDLLQIYPMHPFTVNGKEYDMQNPFQITDSKQSTSIREIYTGKALGTPIETIDSAAAGIKAAKGDKKYMIILTDGEAFYLNDQKKNRNASVAELDARVKKYAGKDMTVMYLGIDVEASKSQGGACMPNAAESEYFVKRKASNSADVLSILTLMCNKIFGRDTLPGKRISGNKVEFDISMKKLIVFVQGKDIENLKLSGEGLGKLVSTQQVKYSTKGTESTDYGKAECVPDTTLQGMMVTYEDCAAGTYTLEYSGEGNNIEVYYEPDADLAFVFTDAAGNAVDPNALYEGDYKVSFGMKDAKTGQLISSDLLGKPTYKGSCFVGDKEYPITHEGFNGSIDVPLEMDDEVEANLTVTYLSGYTITKDSTDFGWPAGGIKVAPRPAGELTLEISGGESLFSLQDLDEGAPFAVKVFYQGTQLTGDALKSAEPVPDLEASNADISVEFAEDHYKLKLGYKNPDAPEETKCGECSVPLKVAYTAKGSSEAVTQGTLTYNIEDDFSPLRLEIIAPEDYIVISDLGKSQPITVNLTVDRAPLSAEDFAAVQLQVDCGGIAHTVTPSQQDSAYYIQLQETNGIKEGDYDIKVTAQFTDHIGRVTETDDYVTITLSNMPMWLKWLIGLLLLILLIILIIAIMRIPAMPKKVNTPSKNCSLTIGAVTFDKATYPSKRSGKQLNVYCKKGTTTFGLDMKVAPGEGSVVSKPQKERSMAVLPKDITLHGGGTTITEATVSGIKFAINPQTKKFEPKQQNQANKPIQLRHGSIVKFNGTMLENGKKKPFAVSTKLDFSKK